MIFPSSTTIVYLSMKLTVILSIDVLHPIEDNAIKASMNLRFEEQYIPYILE